MSAWSAPPVASNFKTFKLDEKTELKIKIPANWETAEKLFGVPLTLLGPEVTATRPSIVVQPTDKMYELDPAGMKAAQPEYQKGRLSWLKKHEGKIISFLPYQFEKIKENEFHKQGMNYSLNGIKFTEWSYYLLCKHRLFFVKALFESKHPLQSQKEAEGAIRSIECR